MWGIRDAKALPRLRNYTELVKFKLVYLKMRELIFEARPSLIIAVVSSANGSYQYDPLFGMRTSRGRVLALLRPFIGGFKMSKLKNHCDHYIDLNESIFRKPLRIKQIMVYAVS